jgi:hypothetical protein
MALYHGPVCRFCRRESQKLFLKGDPRLNVAHMLLVSTAKSEASCLSSDNSFVKSKRYVAFTA